MTANSGRLQRIHKPPCHIKPRLLRDLLKTSRAGHIDLGQAAANQVNPRKQVAGSDQVWPKDRAQCLFLRRQRTELGGRTDVDVAAQIVANARALAARAIRHS